MFNNKVYRQVIEDLDPVLPELVFIWFFIIPAYFAHFFYVKMNWHRIAQRRQEIKFFIFNWIHHFDFGYFIETKL